MFDMFSGGALGRMTVFALNIMPYISASIIIQLMSSAIPSLESLKKEGESGAQEAQPIYPLSDGADRDLPGLRASRSGWRACIAARYRRSLIQAGSSGYPAW